MADIAQLTVQYRSTGYEKVRREVDELDAAGRRVEGENKKVGKSFDTIGKSSGAVVVATNRTKHLEREMSGLSRTMNGLGNVFKHAIGGLIAYAALGAMVEFARSIGDANIKMQEMLNTLRSATGSMAEAKDEFKFLADTADRLGTDLQGSADGYARLAVSAKAAGISTAVLHKAFTGLSEGFAATGRSGDEMNRFLVQLEQGLSQGTLHMRDLRAMAQSFPAAFEIAGEATKRMGSSLNDMLKNGGIPAKQFFITFSQIVHEKFAASAAAAANTIVGQMHRVKNALFELKTGKDVLQPLTDMFKKLADALNSTSGREGIKKIVAGIAQAASAMGSVISVLLKNMDLLILAFKALVLIGAGKVIGMIAGLTLRFSAFSASLVTGARNMAVYSVATRRMSVSMTAASVSARGLSAAMELLGGPIGIAILAAVAAYHLFTKALDESLAAAKRLRDEQLKQLGVLQQQNKLLREYMASLGSLNNVMATSPSAIGAMTTANAGLAASWLKVAKSAETALSAQVKAMGAQASSRVAKLDSGVQYPGRAGDERVFQRWVDAVKKLRDLREEIKKTEATFGSGPLASLVGNLQSQVGMTDKLSKFNQTVQKLKAAAQAEVKAGVISKDAAKALVDAGIKAAKAIMDTHTGGTSTSQQLSNAEKLIQKIKERTQAQALLNAEMKASNGDVSKLTAGQKLLIKFNTELGTTYKGVSGDLIKLIRHKLNDLIASEKQTEATKKHNQALQKLATLQKSLAQSEAAGKGRLATQVATFGQSGTFASQRQQALAGVQTDAARRVAAIQNNPAFTGDTEAMNKAIAAVHAYTNTTVTATNHAYDQMSEKRGSWLAGIKTGWATWADGASNAMSAVKDLTSQTLDGLTNVMDTFFETGKFKWKKFTISILEQIVHIIDKMLIMYAVQKLVGIVMNARMGSAVSSAPSAGFGGQSTGMNFGGYAATGGPVMSGMSYIVGERGPELFTPGSNGNITPNNQLGGSNVVANTGTSKKSVGQVKIVLEDRTDGGVAIEQGPSERSSNGDVMQRYILTTVSKGFRSGGPLDQLMSARYGARNRTYG